ncbi:MAG TPA: cyclase family protein [Mycobacteriales bacterium]|nr:cyclase family protein [Mycobacteriales bacterium]
MDNWGQWGSTDERGAANLIDERAVERGLRAVTQMQAIGLGAPIVSNRGPGVVGRPAPQHFMLRDGGDYAAGLEERAGFGFADDYLSLPTHAVSHIDALAHVWQNGTMYNGFSADTVTSRGAARCGIDKAGPIVTRGVIADLVPAGKDWLPSDHVIDAASLERELGRGEVTLEPGDALLVRTGWMQAWMAGEADATAWPGLGADCSELLVERQVALIGADNLGVEAFPSTDEGCQIPLHVALIRGYGVYFCELLDLAALAATGQSSFLLVVSPLAIRGGVGSPVAPVAII